MFPKAPRLHASENSTATSLVPALTSFAVSPSEYSHFLSGESEPGFGDAVGAGISEKRDLRLESQSKAKT